MTKKEFVEEITKIKGLGKAKAEALYDKGYTDAEKIQKASITDLKKINGITDALAKDLKNQFKKVEQKTQSKQKAAVKPKQKEEKEKTTKTEKTKKQIDSTKEKSKEPADKKEEKEKTKKEKKKIKKKKKPELTNELKEVLKTRKEIKARTPKFLREEWYRYKRIPKNWRRPDGITSKMRINLKYRPSKVRVGFRGPKKTRGLHSSGFEEIIIHNVSDLEKINPKTQAGRIGGTVGTKKRLDIAKKAEELDIRILNNVR